MNANYSMSGNRTLKGTDPGTCDTRHGPSRHTHCSAPLTGRGGCQFGPRISGRVPMIPSMHHPSRHPLPVKTPHCCKVRPMSGNQGDAPAPCTETPGEGRQSAPRPATCLRSRELSHSRTPRRPCPPCSWGVQVAGTGFKPDGCPPPPAPRTTVPSLAGDGRTGQVWSSWGHDLVPGIGPLRDMFPWRKETQPRLVASEHG